MRHRSVLLLAGWAAGCTAHAAPQARPRVQAPAAESAAFVTPARWDYHPPGPTSALATVKLAEGCAFTAEGGQRWSAAATKQVGSRLLCSGKAETSGFVAPEDLSAAIRRADGTWVCVGENGTLYEAESALGPFTRTVPPPEPFARVAGAGSVVLGATLEGRILRWEHQSGWRKLPPSSIDGARVFDLAVAEGGKALALAIPEALFASDDGGTTWTATGAPAVGTRILGRTGAGDLAAQGVFASVVWRPEAQPRFAVRAEKIHVAGAGIDVEVGRAPSAAAVQAGRAVLDEGRYYEVIRPENDGEAWQLARGRLEGRLETVTLPDSGRCSNLRLGARGKVVVLVCVSQAEGEIAAEVRRSADAGTTWADPLKLVTPDTDQVNVAVSPAGGALLTGVCKPSESGNACKPSAPVLIRVDGGALRAFPASAPQLSGMALLPAFSVDGLSAYFLGRRGKDDRISLFVSHDAGESFSPRTLESTVARAARRPRADDADEEPAESNEGPDTFDVEETSSLRPGEDGTVGMLLQRSRGGFAYVTADDDGRVLQMGLGPEDESVPVMSGYGRRLIAVTGAAAETGAPGAWESLDGGVTWEVQTAPQSLAREYARGNGNPPVVCSLAGCLVGDTVTRVGWGGQGDAAPAERPPEAAPPTQSVLTPIVCDLSPNTKWSRVENLHGAWQPDIGTAMRGRSVWSALSLDHRTGAISVTSATLPESGAGEARVIQKTMLGGSPPGQRVAMDISMSQLEGYAVARVQVPVDAKGQLKSGAPMRNVEVAWENFLDGSSGRSRIADAGPFERADVEGANAFKVALISITSRGLFLRPHAAEGRGVLEYFLDTAGRVERYEPPSFPSASPLGVPLDVVADAASIGGELLSLGRIRERRGEWASALVSRRNKPGASGPWTTTAMSVLPRIDDGSLLIHGGWASSSKSAIGIAALVADPTHMRAWAHFIGFRSDGTFLPAEPLPTLFDLGDRPRPCAPADRAGTPRFPVRFAGDRPFFPGMRHPVLVQEPRPRTAVGVAEPIVLLTSHAVVHGTPPSPCIAAWEAIGLGRSPTVGAIIPGDLSRAWIFRPAAEPPRPNAGRRGEPAVAGPALEYRPMSCRFDPAARIPEAVWSEPGTSRP